MSAMTNPSGGFRTTLWTGWALLSVIGVAFARWKGIPNWAALPSLAAFLIVYPFYLVPAFPRVREQLSGAPLPGFLVACAVLPYLACCTGAVQFQFVSFLKLVALALALGLWYRVLPVHPLTDAGFLLLFAAVKLGRYGASIYPTPYQGVQIFILTDLSLIIMSILVLMLERRIRETGYGFLPTRKDWRIGAKNFLYFLPFGIALGFVLQVGKLVTPHDPLKLAGYVIGALFGTALAEEFLFRGVLQQWIEDWTWSRRTALILTSILFGAAHLWFRQFPNWKWWIIAGTLGWFCGRARNQAGSIRAAMVTHTLVITMWRAFLA
ncbi:MAG: CPBP family intramembrane glutamic endopeptidase [Candidatus Solibacter sp.]